MIPEYRSHMLLAGCEGGVCMARLDERKRKVLRAVVEVYVANAEPVGSRTIARESDLGVSSATIRNEMADLEELGYLEQPHTSAGRMPSDAGYRFYVDEMANISSPTHLQLERMREALGRHASEVDAVLEATGKLLSEITDCLSLVAEPSPSAAVLNTVEMVPLGDHRMMLLIVTEEGFVHNRIVDHPEGVSLEKVKHVSSVLTNYLRGYNLGDVINSSVVRAVHSELNHCRQLLDVVMEILSSYSSDDAETRYRLEGAANIMKQPEFQDVRRAQKVLRVLSQRSVARNLFKGVDEDDIFVLIGSENRYEVISDCSVVTSTYYIRGQSAGRIGVLGPRRMNYGRVMGMVKTLTSLLSEALDG